MTLVKSLYSGDPEVIVICMAVGAIRVKVISPSNGNNSKPSYIWVTNRLQVSHVWHHMHWGSHVEVPNNQRISFLDSSLGRVPACDAGDPGSNPGGGKLKICLQGALLEDRDNPGQLSL